MRIDRLKLPRYKNLVDFEVDFDQSSARQVVVGRNGVGKSNLLEAIVRIFRDLDLEEPSAFEYAIEYFCRGVAVRVSNVAQETSGKFGLTGFKRSYEIADHKQGDLLPEKNYFAISEVDFYRRNKRDGLVTNPKRLLPSYVFGYYSGDIGRFEGIFAKHEEKYYADQVKGDEVPLRTLFLSRPHHSQFAFLSFLAIEDEQASKFLQDELRIEGLDAVLFALREPYWSKGRKSKKGDEGDTRFWGAAGKVAPFLDTLFANSFAPMAFSERLRVSVGQTETKERRFCYLPNSLAVAQLAGGLSNKEFFARLESLVYSNVVSEDGSDVRIWLRLKDVDASATFNDLAEGERQLLTVLGLLRFTADEEALFILDEPDTHLNPAWCLDYLDNLQKYGASLDTSQIIMTTHSPLTFAGLEKNEVVVLQRERDGSIRAEHPVSSPRGMGFSAILTSDYFGLRSTLDRPTLEKLDKRRELGLKVDKTDQDLEELTALDLELGRLDFSKSVRDPLYQEFVRAITAAQKEHPEIADAAPLMDEWQVRKELAADIAKRLLNKEEN
jgi:predicted ATPase